MLKLFILLTIVLISTFSAIDGMASEDQTFLAIQDRLWVEGVADEELVMAEKEDYLPEELATALEKI